MIASTAVYVLLSPNFSLTASSCGSYVGIFHPFMNWKARPTVTYIDSSNSTFIVIVVVVVLSRKIGAYG